MAEDTFKNILFAFILVALFGFLIISSVGYVADNYDKDTSEVTAGSLDIDNFNDSVSGVRTASQNFQDRFNKGSIWSALAGVVVEGIFGIAKDMIAIILFPFNVISNIMMDVFGVPAIVTDVILGILILGIIFSIWRLLKIGD